MKAYLAPLYLLLTFLWTVGGYADGGGTISIEAAVLDYNGTAVTLSGQVTIEHAMGRLLARHAVLTPKEGEAAGLSSIGKITLCDQVEVFFANGGYLRCDHADLDGDTLYGLFSSYSPDSPALYRQQGKEEMWELSGKEIEVALSIQGHPPGGPSGQYAIDHVLARDYVVIRHGDLLTAEAGVAIYRPEKKVATKDLEDLGGTLHLLTGRPGSLCRIADAKGDWVQSRQITVDIASRRFIFDPAVGVINAESPLHFSAAGMLWDDIAGVMTLDNDISLTSPLWGELNCDDRVVISATTAAPGAPRTIERAICTGSTVLSHTPPQGTAAERETLTCYGTVEVNHLLGKIVMTSAPGQLTAGEGLVERLVDYRGSYGEVAAECAELSYTPGGAAPMKVEHLSLERRVRMVRHLPATEAKAETYQYALANRVDFFPERQELSLLGDNTTPVVFVDTTDQMHMSAKKISAHRDPITGRDTVHGVGGVRFTLNDAELAQMKKHFVMD